jgi:hypothetical protein
MRIFNEEVFNCGQCPLAIRDEYYVGCQKLDKEFYSFDAINKDCPFNKPITKEVIEGFGFYHFYDDFTFGVYTKNMGNDHMWNMTYDYSDKSCRIIEVDSNDSEIFGETFIGTINNPIELEFILRSIGAIE